MADVQIKDRLTTNGGLVTDPASPGAGVPYTLGVQLQADSQHGDRGGGSLHAVATDAVAGFMSAAMKTALDAATAAIAAFANTITSRRFKTESSTFAYTDSSTPSLDVSAYNIHRQTDTLTGDIAITLASGSDGDRGIVWLKQDGTGGRKLTGVTASGRTVIMTPAMGASFNNEYVVPADAVFGVGYEYASVGGTDYVLIWPITTGTAGYA